MSNESTNFIAGVIESSGLFDSFFYARQITNDQVLTTSELIRHYVEIGESRGLLPSPMFDVRYYVEQFPDLHMVENKFAHYIQFGAKEGRKGSFVQLLIDTGLDVEAVAKGMIPDPVVDRGAAQYPRALHAATLACEQGHPYFSNSYYLDRCADLPKDLVAPLGHYLQHGMAEGRKSNLDVKWDYNPDRLVEKRQWILVGVHEGSETGAPVVGLEIGRELAKKYNVIFLSLRDGPLLARARHSFPVTVCSSFDQKEIEYLVTIIESQYSPKRGIFSSVVCEPAIRALADSRIQIITAVHEFREYSYHVERSVACFSDLMVFSSSTLEKSWEILLLDVSRPPLTTLVLPQPASLDGRRQQTKADARRAVELATGLDLNGAVVVLGAGQVQIRKGTDIFVQVANQLRRKPGRYVCVWIGEMTLARESELSYGVWLHALIERSRDAEGIPSVHFEDAGPLYPALMDAADVFLVPSRLDPLPNVALDAASRNLPVVSFRDATGLGDLARDGRINLTEVEYCSADQMVYAVSQLTNNLRGLLRRLFTIKAREDREVPVQTYADYCQTVFARADELEAHSREPNVNIDASYVGPVFGAPFDEISSAQERRKTIALTRRLLKIGISWTNPRPGVHSTRTSDGELLTYRSIITRGQISRTTPNILVHIHAFYPEMLPELLGHFAGPAKSTRFIVTTTDEARCAEIRLIFDNLGFGNKEIVVCENRGRDIGPFLDVVAGKCLGSEIIGHLHTKKSPELGIEYGQKWRHALYSSLLSQETIDLFNDSTTGLVFPDSSRSVGWGKNWLSSKRLASHFNVDIPSHPGPFPMGNMFFVRGSVARAMRDATRGMAWPAEPVPYDGTVLHAVERVWPLACRALGLEWAAVHRRKTTGLADPTEG